MKRTAFWYWMIPSSTPPGRIIRSSYRMDEETAQQRFPGCVKAPHQREPEWRDLPETDAELLANTKPFDPKTGY